MPPGAQAVKRDDPRAVQGFQGSDRAVMVQGVTELHSQGRLNSAPWGDPGADPPWGQGPAGSKPGAAAPAARNRASSPSAPVAESKVASSTRVASFPYLPDEELPIRRGHR
jgi:hypothetical protein